MQSIETLICHYLLIQYDNNRMNMQYAYSTELSKLNLNYNFNYNSRIFHWRAK